MCKGVYGCVRVYKDVYRCVRVCKGGSGCIRMYKGVSGCVRVCKDVQGEQYTLPRRAGINKSHRCSEPNKSNAPIFVEATVDCCIVTYFYCLYI